MCPGRLPPIHPGTARPPPGPNRYPGPALSRFVEGRTLQSAKDKAATYTPDGAVQKALDKLAPKERDQLVTRAAKALGFEGASLNDANQEWTLNPMKDGMYLRPLDWEDPELRRSAARQAVWAVKTAQVDNHPGNYMVVKSSNGSGHTLNSFDNDQSMGRLITQPTSLSPTKVAGPAEPTCTVHLPARPPASRR